MKNKKEIGLDIFDTPLTKRGYLANKTVHIIHQFTNCKGGQLSLAHTASILYLYGADFRGLYNFDLEGTHQSNKDYLKKYKVPSICFTFRNQPLVSKNNEIEIISNGLKKSGYKDTWYPYQWTTEDGDKVREIIDPILSKSKDTTEMKKWNNDFEKLKDIVNVWHIDFLKKNKKKYDFEIKLYDYGNSCIFTTKDDKHDQIKGKDAVRERQYQYLKAFDDFAKYLYKGFLEEKDIFPKCLYE